MFSKVAEVFPWDRLALTGWGKTKWFFSIVNESFPGFIYTVTYCGLKKKKGFFFSWFFKLICSTWNWSQNMLSNFFSKYKFFKALSIPFFHVDTCTWEKSERAKCLFGVSFCSPSSVLCSLSLLYSVVLRMKIIWFFNNFLFFFVTLKMQIFYLSWLFFLLLIVLRSFWSLQVCKNSVSFPSCYPFYVDSRKAIIWF